MKGGSMVGFSQTAIDARRAHQALVEEISSWLAASGRTLDDEEISILRNGLGRLKLPALILIAGLMRDLERAP